MQTEKDLAHVATPGTSTASRTGGKNEAAHTPGPWRVRRIVDRAKDLSYCDVHFGIAAGSEEWRDNAGHWHPDDSKFAVDEIEVVALGYDRDYGYPEGGIRNEADARLIAAAPDLLSACKALIDEGPSNDVKRLVEAAIAKAEGKAL